MEPKSNKEMKIVVVSMTLSSWVRTMELELQQLQTVVQGNIEGLGARWALTEKRQPKVAVESSCLRTRKLQILRTEELCLLKSGIRTHLAQCHSFNLEVVKAEPNPLMLKMMMMVEWT